MDRRPKPQGRNDLALILLSLRGMRLLGKFVMKLVTLVIMVAVMGVAARCARPYLMRSAGLPQEMPSAEGGGKTPHFSSEESDLMATVFKSAIRLLTGNGSRKELAGELSAKLYAGRADSNTMSELGIELVQPGANPNAASSASAGTTGGPAAASALSLAKSGDVKSGAPSGSSPGRDAMLAQIYHRAVANPELSFAPVVLVGMFAVGRMRRRRSLGDDLILPDLGNLLPSESDPYNMQHAVHALKAEDFELLVALIYQRQGYRVSMPAGLSGGRGGDFLLTRKSERWLVQCKKLSQDHKVPVERVRELHEAMIAAGASRGLYVASCGFTWDARNFAKSKGITVVNARTLDGLIASAKEKADENLLAVSKWAPQFMAKVKLTSPLCPTCESAMDPLKVSAGSVWVCSQRPDCRGRRSARSYQDASRSAPGKA